MALFTRRKAIALFPFVTLASPSSLFLFNPSSANAEPQVATKPSGVQLLSQGGRPPASLPMSTERPFFLQDVDSKLSNVNWVRGNEARAEWTWAAQLMDPDVQQWHFLTTSGSPSSRYLEYWKNNLIIPPVSSSTRPHSETVFKYRDPSTA